ncbi:MAG: cell division protein FtsQ/DivIB [Actinomycetota bacterium]
MTTSGHAGAAAPTPATIDPRIRARRIEVKRTEGRRRLQRLVEATLVMGVAAAFVLALWTPLLDVDEVSVEGAERTTPEMVLDMAGVNAGDSLISVDVGKVGERLAALPWVAEVSVRRGVDGTVAIDVTERTPVALVRSGALGLLIDRDGRVLGPAPSAGGVAMIELTGVGVVPDAGAFLAEEHTEALVLAERLGATAPGAFVSLDAVELIGRLGQGGAVRFGDASRIEAKLRSLRTVLDQVDLRCLALIDLRLPGSPVLTREEGCS